MARATPANYISPQISDDEDDLMSDEDAKKIAQNAATSYVFSSKRMAGRAIQKKKSIASIYAAKPRPGKSRFSCPRQHVMNNDDPMCIGQITANNETFDASKALVVYLGDTSLNQLDNNNNSNIMACEPKLLFSDEELKGVLNIERVEEDFIQVLCACTSHKYGDYVGILTVYRDGKLRIDCQCAPGCDLEDATPEQFVSHARTRQGPGQWQTAIWIHVEYKKTKIKDTALLKYFGIAGLKVEKKVRFKPHRDEFIECSKCGVERRFKLRSVEECMAFHDAELMRNNWTCSMHPLGKMNCDSEGERESRKVVRGCTRLGSCGGCTQCICFGCLMCRFADCGCQACVDHFAMKK